MIFELAQDFRDAIAAMPREHPKRRMLELLEEAIWRDIHFIVRHPTTLFQCLWNSCWWYDCDEAADHYVVPEGGWPPGEPSWEQAGPRLSTFLEGWRSFKERTAPGFTWLRSLRPPAIHLGTAQKRIFRVHEDRDIISVSYSPDGRRIASGSDDCTIRVWDAESGGELHCLRGHDNTVTSVCYSPDGRQIASGSDDRTIRVWDAESGREDLRSLRGHTGYFFSCRYSPDGGRIAMWSHDNSVRVWDAETGAELHCLRGHDDRVTCVCYSPDGRQIASAYGGILGTVHVWDIESGRELRCFLGHEGGVKSVSFSPDGRRLLSAGSDDKKVRVWDVETGAEPLTFFFGDDSGFVYSPDGRRILGTVHVWDAESGARVEVIHGTGDYVAVAAGRASPFRAVRDHLDVGCYETVIKETGGAGPVVWFPEGLDRITAHPGGLMWVGNGDSHVCLIVLEGSPRRATCPAQLPSEAAARDGRDVPGWDQDDPTEAKG